MQAEQNQAHSFDGSDSDYFIPDDVSRAWVVQVYGWHVSRIVQCFAVPTGNM